MDILTYTKTNEIKNIVAPYNKGVFAAARAELDAEIARILNAVFIGDSITQGAGSSATVANWQELGYFGIVRDHFATEYEDVGKGFRPIYDYNTAGDYNPWTFSGSWTDQGGWGAMGQGKKSSAANDTATIAFNGTGVAICITTGASSTDTFEMIVDGGTPVEYSAYQLTGSRYATTFTVTGLDAGDHTLVVKNTTTGSGILLLNGAYALKGTAGIRCHMMGRSGKTINEATYADPIMQLTHDKFAPELTVISMLANDHSTHTDIKTYTTRLESLITRARTYGDVILMLTGMSDTGDYDFVGYVNANRYLANKHGCKIVDIYTAWGKTWTAANALGFMADTVHPNAAGHADIAARLIAAIDAL